MAVVRVVQFVRNPTKAFAESTVLQIDAAAIKRYQIQAVIVLTASLDVAESDVAFQVRLIHGHHVRHPQAAEPRLVVILADMVNEGYVGLVREVTRRLGSLESLRR